MPYVVGVVLAAAVCLLSTMVGLDRDRAFYPIVTIVVASYYALFAVMAGSMAVLAVESLVITAFLLAAVAGFKRSLWIVAAALAGHGLLDSVHGRLVANAGVPPWWPPFCLAFDLTAAGYLAWRLRRSAARTPARVQGRGEDHPGGAGAAK